MWMFAINPKWQTAVCRKRKPILTHFSLWRELYIVFLCDSSYTCYHIRACNKFVWFICLLKDLIWLSNFADSKHVWDTGLVHGHSGHNSCMVWGVTVLPYRRPSGAVESHVYGDDTWLHFQAPGTFVSSTFGAYCSQCFCFKGLASYNCYFLVSPRPGYWPSLLDEFVLFVQLFQEFGNL